MRHRYEKGATMPRNRADEAEAFGLLAHRLEAASDVASRTRAAHLARRVWMLLVSDLGTADNALPVELRADLVSLGLAQIRDADRLISGDEEAAARMVDVCLSVQAGLAPPAVEAGP